MRFCVYVYVRVCACVRERKSRGMFVCVRIRVCERARALEREIICMCVSMSASLCVCTSVVWACEISWELPFFWLCVCLAHSIPCACALQYIFHIFKRRTHLRQQTITLKSMLTRFSIIAAALLPVSETMCAQQRESIFVGPGAPHNVNSDRGPQLSQGG